MQACDILHTHTALHPGTARLTLTGELDAATAPLLETALSRALAHHPHCLELDLSALVFCDVAGLRALHHARHAARAQHTALHLTGLHPRLHHILTLMNATQLTSPPRRT